MSLVVTAVLQTASFDAASDDPARLVAEWPPHPQRLFSALVDAAGHSGLPPSARSAIEWLEQQEPPEIRAAKRATTSTHSAFVPVNSLPDKAKHTLYPGRVAAGTQKSWPRVFPATPVIRFVWPDASPDTATAETLGQLARTVPYLGRASSPVVLSVEVAAEIPPLADSEQIWQPDPAGDIALRVPFPGSLQLLAEAYEVGELLHEIRDEVPYRAGRRSEATPVLPQSLGRTRGPRWELVTFQMRPAPGLDGSSALAITSQLRRSVNSRIGESVPGLVHGHDTNTHVAWLALPDVGHDYASGRLLGVGVAIPAGAPVLERGVLLRALLGSADSDGISALSLPPPLTRAGVVGLERPGGKAPYAVVARRWTGPSRRWASVTPVVWDRFTRSEEALGQQLRLSLSRAGYPDPVEDGLLWSRSSFVRGGAHPRPDQVRRAGQPPLPFRHVMVEFGELVEGPLLVGRMRHFGLGLFVPLCDDNLS
jgi:CRISPR-associated protein Csb2